MRAKVRLTAGELHERLGLPDTVRISYAYADPDPIAVYLVLESDDLAGGIDDGQVAAGIEAPLYPTS